MNASKILQLRENFSEYDINELHPATSNDIINFQNLYNVTIPDDMLNYYISINGTHDNLLNNLFEFYSIKRTNTVREEFEDWQGIPEYQNLAVENFENVFVFANYEFNFYAFAIELFKHSVTDNKVYVICGEDYKIIANNFSEFIDLYLNNSEDIYI